MQASCEHDRQPLSRWRLYQPITLSLTLTPCFRTISSETTISKWEAKDMLPIWYNILYWTFSTVPPQSKHPCSVCFHEGMASFTDKLTLVVIRQWFELQLLLRPRDGTVWVPGAHLGRVALIGLLGWTHSEGGKYHGRPFLTSLMRQPRERYLSSTLPFSLSLPLLCISVPRFLSTRINTHPKTHTAPQAIPCPPYSD